MLSGEAQVSPPRFFAKLSEQARLLLLGSDQRERIVDEAVADWGRPDDRCYGVGAVWQRTTTIETLWI